MGLGFSAPFSYNFWPQDGWYVTNPTQLAHIWIGQNSRHVLERLETMGDQYVKLYLLEDDSFNKREPL